MKIFRTLSWVVALAAMGMFSSCSSEDILNDTTKPDGETAVKFTVSDVQNDAQNNSGSLGAKSSIGGTVAHADFVQQLAMQALSPADLSTQRLPIMGHTDVCLIETTVAGINPTKTENEHTRANIITTATLGSFSSSGYRGSSATAISTTPWFYNKATNPDGTLVESILWSWSQPYAKFYAVYPQVGSDPKITLSPSTYSGTPYVDFEVEPAVRQQKDLLTACSGMVQYAVQGTAPQTNLAFRHALTAIHFKVGQNLSLNKTISKVEIVNALSKGRYTLSSEADGTGAAWSNVSTPATFTLDELSISTSQAVNQVIIGNDGDNFTFYMIPQALDGIKVNIYFSDGTYMTANLTGTWKAGTTKTYALSESNSSWTYVLNTTSPATAASSATSTENYGVTSYRKAPDGTQQAVAWRVVGYDSNADGKFSLDEKPSWLTSLTKQEGPGGTAAETGSATLAAETETDLLAQRNNALKNAAPKGSAASYWNLSNPKGEDAVKNTANCYVISAPGYYRIPLVYGNAITNGTTNSHAYISQASSSTTLLKNFIDHNGKNITDPWITQSNNQANIPDAATLVWADVKGLVTTLTLTGSGNNAFVNFVVPAAAIENGNAVIAVTKNGVVVWSWHLWFAPQEVLQTTACTSSSNYVFNFTNETLGFKYTTWKGSSPRSVKVMVEQTVANNGTKQSGVIDIRQNGYTSQVQGYSTLYQFGRKDAMPGTSTISEGTFTQNGGDKVSIPNSIKYPGTFYTYGSGTSWTSYHKYTNLWSADNTKTVYNEDVVYKTVYDPCPAGFKMTPIEAFSFTAKSDGKTANTVGSWINGWNFNNKRTSPDATIYFPVTGMRLGTDGALSQMNTSGNYWHATPTSDIIVGYILRFDITTFDWASTAGNGTAYAVRPVTE